MSDKHHTTEHATAKRRLRWLSPMWTPGGFVLRAVLIVVIYLGLDMLGFRENTSFVSGTVPDGGTLGVATVLPGLLYFVSWFAVVLVAPVLLIGSGLWWSVDRMRDKQTHTVIQKSRPCRLIRFQLNNAMTYFPHKVKRYLFRRLLSLIFIFLGVSFIPFLLCSVGADDFFYDSYTEQLALQQGVKSWVTEDLDTSNFSTGSPLFNGEWLFGTYMMAGMGFGQMAVLHPELKDQNILLLERCIEKILSKEVKAFDTTSWGGEDPIETLGIKGAGDHVAYLGYLNLLLSLNRYINPDNSFNQLNDKITNVLAAKLSQSGIYALETYYLEIYPVDNCAAIASIGLYDKATGGDHSSLLGQLVDYYRQFYIETDTGLLVQSIDETGKWTDYPRGSGTTLGLYFLSFTFPDFAAELYSSIKSELASSLFNFGVVREYPQGVAGTTDIDTGPIVLGYGFSATGFTISGSKIFRDESYFKKLFAMSTLVGAPYQENGEKTYITGGPLGTAILFAMFSALPEGAI